MRPGPLYSPGGGDCIRPLPTTRWAARLARTRDAGESSAHPATGYREPASRVFLRTTRPYSGPTVSAGGKAVSVVKMPAFLLAAAWLAAAEQQATTRSAH